jgi:hypothetical protein
VNFRFIVADRFSFTDKPLNLRTAVEPAPVPVSSTLARG